MSDGRSLDFTKFIVIPREEIEADFEAVVEKMNDDGPPILVTNGEVPEVVIMPWEYYWQRFGGLYSEEEKTSIEEACRNCKDSETNN